MAIQCRKTKTGKPRYLVKVFRGRDAEGRRLEAFRTFGLLSDARRWEREPVRAIERGEFIEPSREPLALYLRNWLAGPARMKIRETTLEGYARILKRYVLRSELGTFILGRLST